LLEGHAVRGSAADDRYMPQVGVQGGDVLGWTVVAIAVIGVALDGVDGRLARSRNTSSDFGARFDMEIDALLILVLAVLVWNLEKAGMWILAAGLLRYAFVLASYPLPWMERALPRSRPSVTHVAGLRRQLSDRASQRRDRAVASASRSDRVRRADHARVHGCRSREGRADSECSGDG